MENKMETKMEGISKQNGRLYMLANYFNPDLQS